MRSLACLLLLATATSAQTVEGTIIDITTGRGIPAARVRLVKAGERAGQPLYSATADSDGHFRIDDVKDGAYAPRYFADHFFAADARPAGPEFHVTAGTPVHLEGRLSPYNHVTGRVRDGRGDPVPNAHVELTLPQAFWAGQTDAEGRFDLDSVMPGGADYRLSAVPPAGWKPPESEPDTDEKRAWARTFYPGAIWRADAAPLTLTPGLDSRDLEIRLVSVSVHAIRGTLLNADGAPAAKVSLSLWDNSPQRDPSYQTESRQDGSFEFPAVAEGDWYVASNSGALRAREWVEVRRRDVDLGKLRLAPPFTLRGRMILDAPPGMAKPKSLAVLLIPQHAGVITFSAPIRDTVPSPDNTFRFDQVYAGTYVITPGEPTPPFYVDAVRLGENAVDGEVELSAASPEVTIFYKANGGTVRGTVENCGAGQVLLRTVAGLDWGSRMASCDSSDRFEIAGIKPGEYYALAFPADRPVSLQTAAPFLPTAARITVRAGEVTRADLKLSGLR